MYLNHPSNTTTFWVTWKNLETCCYGNSWLFIVKGKKFDIHRCTVLSEKWMMGFRLVFPPDGTSKSEANPDRILVECTFRAPPLPNYFNHWFWRAPHNFSHEYIDELHSLHPVLGSKISCHPGVKTIAFMGPWPRVQDPKSHMGVSKNKGTPKWMVYSVKPYWNGMIWGYHYFRKHPYLFAK